MTKRIVLLLVCNAGGAAGALATENRNCSITSFSVKGFITPRHAMQRSHTIQATKGLSYSAEYNTKQSYCDQDAKQRYL
ncbi:uncharacterized protein ZBIST_1263 [Zygosaccharomyces bailii]|nr:uncharacterized protein ZBIST_1263 [Zygosaccharomyces bailii]